MDRSVEHVESGDGPNQSKAEGEDEKFEKCGNRVDPVFLWPLV